MRLRDALQEAIHRYGVPEIFNTDQGCQFTSPEFTTFLKEYAIDHQHGRQGLLARQCVRGEIVEERKI